METKCSQSRARAKVVFKGTCFKCGMRGHKADRCSQKGKGKGGKGDLGERRRWIQRKGMVQRTRVKPWSHVGQFLVSFQLARQSVWS